MPSVGVEIATIEVVGFDVSNKFDQTFTVKPAASGPVAYGPRISRTNVVPPDLTVEVYHRATPSALAVELDESFNRSFQDQLSQPGTGSLSVMNDDTDLASVQDGDLVRFVIKDHTAFTMLARDFEKVTLAAGEESEQFTTISGPGHLAVLDEAVVYPILGIGVKPVEEDRVFGWASPNYDDSGWDSFSAIMASGITDWWYGPNAWPGGLSSGLGSYWIWSPLGDFTWAPQGDCYFRKQFTVPTAGFYSLYALADDRCRVYIDGALVITSRSWTNTNQDINSVEVEFSAGQHTIAVWANNNDGQIGNNPAGIRVLIAERYPDGSFSTSPVLVSDNTWRVLSYPATEPGMTPGEVLRRAIQEAQFRGAIPEVTFGFSDDVDSAGVPWTIQGDISTKIGTTVLGFAMEMAGTYMDIAMRQGSFVLDAWVKGGRGSTRSATYAATTNPATSNLAGLVHRRAY